MRLKSFGCSFIHGTELSDDCTTGSQLTWPAHLAKHLGRVYHCHARGGSGNLQVLERVLHHIDDSDGSDLFVIGWTWIDRHDYYDSNSTPDEISRSTWMTITPSDQTIMSKTYYRDLHSEYRDKFTNLSYIKLAIDSLNQKKIPFVMTYMDELLFDQQWHMTPAVEYLQSYVRPYMTTFEGKTFLEWSRAHGYQETALWHPLEAAHRDAGAVMCQVFDKQNTSDC